MSSSPRVVAFGKPVPKGGGVYRVGKPYVVGGRRYVPREDPDYHAVGLASWYGNNFHGRLTANGEVFDMTALTAAHPTLPLPSYVRVTNLGNGRSLIVRVNDRGPYHGHRLIDVSNRAAKLLKFKRRGVAKVRVDYVGPAPLEGSDDRKLVATLRVGEPAPSSSLVRVASGASVAPRDVPLPEGRPYGLGRETHVASARFGSSPAAYTSSEISAARSMEPNSRSGNRRLADNASRLTHPVSAYAAVDRNGPRELLSGRGLY